MITKEELHIAIADNLHQLRIKKNFSKAKMASTLFMDDKTWARYESGTTAPTVPEFLWIYDQLGENALRSVLNIIYPDTYKSLTSTECLRESAAHYFKHVASDHTVREWNFLTFGNHGSNIESQIQLFTLIDHLPLECRVVLASTAMAMWEMCCSRDSIRSREHIMPNISVLKDGMEKAIEAVHNGEHSYTTSLK